MNHVIQNILVTVQVICTRGSGMASTSKHSWYHLKLFAQICDCDDDAQNVTENWVKMLENQHEMVFPFTLWPLTYRTSTVILSSSLSSPKVKRYTVDPHQCEITVKLYRSNEVVVICFQHRQQDAKVSCPCNEWCKFQTTTDNHHGQHSNDNSIPLVKCQPLSIFALIRQRVMAEFSKMDQNEISAVICTGYDKGGMLATFMASELASDFKMEAEFMEYDHPRVSVDCVSFSLPEVGNDTYWKKFNGLVDNQIHVRHHTDKAAKKSPKPSVVVGSRRDSSRKEKDSSTCQRIVREIDNNMHASSSTS
ncbi:FirrV-1-B39 [Feldmannia irregularis virus a]|uniref:FirrV-1-B39 n=1 Tax=Feldmannia irregularis virus a TaxID=231992 RepID=Q6XLZ7_9PHYC|nr:FirrV-1-B39 [Feldmannia irregularis virus a]AAR26914.1 FirrV-1-B39 [Feldmannia irregularis virus a]